MAQFELTEFELKMLRLALCASAQGGEISTGAEKLIKSLRARGVDSFSLKPRSTSPANRKRSSSHIPTGA